MYYGDVIRECFLMDGAVEVITKLKNDGDKIYFISARITSIANCATLEITEETLSRYGIPYDGLFIAAFDKLKYSMDNGIDVFVEDDLEMCKILEDNGIKTYLMTTVINAHFDSGEIERVSNWDELYEKIISLRKNNEFVKRKL